MNYETNAHYSTTREEQGLGELFATLSNQASQLFRQEVQLAQAEMTNKAMRAGKNVALRRSSGSSVARMIALCARPASHIVTPPPSAASTSM